MKNASRENVDYIKEISILKRRIRELEHLEGERKRVEHRQHLAAEIMGILNDSSTMTDSINLILAAIKGETGFDAVGIRLRSGDDFPYFVHDGFSHDFLLTENKLIARDASGSICRDESGNISLECTCGLVISGQTDPTNRLFTQGGSFWTNDSLPLLDLSADQDPRLNPRNRCIHEGFHSVALIPIRVNREIVGLLQLNDQKKGRFTLDMITFFEGLGSSIGIALTRKQAEEALKERTSQLEAINRELESFSYSVSHDLRAPLRAIYGYSRMILRKQGNKFDEETLSQLRSIRKNVEIMSHLIDDLLSFSCLGKQEISKVSLDMEGIIRDVWQNLLTINPDRSMTLRIAGIQPGMGDRSLMREVFSNLLGNAVKFTSNRDIALIDVESFVEDNETIYCIRDNGIGFDMKYHDNLFGVFQRLHSADKYEGTGIGLALVRRITNRHGGRVWAESEEDKGATFCFSLPTRLS